jgi:hypothetical protein
MPADAAVHGTLYHLPATPPRGDEIVPLRGLRTQFPDLYERHTRKYAGRPDDLNRRVEPLGCTWGEVVFLSPVHPAPLFAALSRSALGARPVAREPWALDAGCLDPARAVIRLMRHGQHADPPDEHDYLPFTTASLRAVSRVTLAAVRRLEALQPGDPWLPWVDVPHVLYRGAIPVSWFARPRSSAPLSSMIENPGN